LGGGLSVDGRVRAAPLGRALDIAAGRSVDVLSADVVAADVVAADVTADVTAGDFTFSTRALSVKQTVGRVR